MKPFEKKIACEVCTVAKYCGTMVSSIRLCRSIHEQKIKKMFEIVDIDTRQVEGAYVVIKIKDNYFRVDKANSLNLECEDFKDTLVIACNEEGKVKDWTKPLWEDKSGKSLYHVY